MEKIASNPVTSVAVMGFSALRFVSSHTGNRGQREVWSTKNAENSQKHSRRSQLCISKTPAQKVGRRCGEVSAQGSQQVCLSRCPKSLTLQSLLFSISLFFFFPISLVFLCIFLSFPRIFGVPRRETPLLFGGFPSFFQKSKGWRARDARSQRFRASGDFPRIFLGSPRNDPGNSHSLPEVPREPFIRKAQSTRTAKFDPRTLSRKCSRTSPHTVLRGYLRGQASTGQATLLRGIPMGQAHSGMPFFLVARLVPTKMPTRVYTKMSTEMPMKVEAFFCVKRTRGSPRRLPRECSREIFQCSRKCTRN